MAVVYAPTMGNIFGDAWRKIKSDPLVLAPPLWLGKESIKLLPTIVQGARTELRDTVGAFRPQPQVQPLSSALTLGGDSASGGESALSGALPIIVGAVVAGGLLLLAFGRKKK